MDESMKNNSLNPFDRFLKNPELDMLNAALPYVSGHMRTPLALYIKSLEMRRILSDFGSEEILSACGFEKNAPDPEAMLKAMKIAGGKNANPQIDQLLHLMNLLKTYQSFNEILQTNPELASFINGISNQQQPSGTHSYNNTAPSKDSSPNNSPSPTEILKQFTNSDAADMMTFLSQLMKKS